MNLCHCGETLTVLGGTLLECLGCFAKNMADHNVETLILRARLGIMAKPIQRKGAEYARAA